MPVNDRTMPTINQHRIDRAAIQKRIDGVQLGPTDRSVCDQSFLGCAKASIDSLFQIPSDNVCYQSDSASERTLLSRQQVAAMGQDGLGAMVSGPNQRPLTG